MSSASLQWLYFEIQDQKKKKKKHVNKACSASLHWLYFEIWDLLSIEQSRHEPWISYKKMLTKKKKKTLVNLRGFTSSTLPSPTNSTHIQVEC